MDPLSQAIGLLRPKALLWKIVQGSGDWALRFPEEKDVVFGQVIAGTCRLELKGLEPRQLCIGDFLLLTAPATWVLRNGNEAVPLDFESVYEGPAQPLTLVGNPDGVNVTRFMAGHFTFDAANAELLLGLMPSLIHVRPSDKAAGRLCGLLELIGDEATSNRPGQSLVLERLLDVMLIESLRHQPGYVGTTRRGLLAGLADPKVAVALRDLHRDVSHGWTVAELAKRAGMSRSVFAERFAETVGMAPIDYLLSWRMALAKDALRSTNRPLSEIAATIGYQSASAFSTAFSRVVGCPPARYGARRGELSSSI